MTEVGAARSSSETPLDPLLRGSFFFGSKPISDKVKAEYKRFLEALVRDLDEDEPREMPPLWIVMFPDLVGKAWGWQYLLPIDGHTNWSVYARYLELYYHNNAAELNACATADSLLDMVERCLKKESQLASMWNNLLESHADAVILRKHIMLSSLVKECARSVILKKRVYSSADLVVPTFMCIEKETDLIHELLFRGAPWDDELIKLSNEIRMCALGLLGHCYKSMSCYEVAAGAMLGITKEASMMRKWMSDNDELLDISCISLPDRMGEADRTRCRTLQFMTSILTMPYTPAAVLKTGMEATDTKGDDAQDQEKIIVDGNSKKRKRIEEEKTDIIEGCRPLLTKQSQHDGVPCHLYSCQIKLERERTEAGASMSRSVVTVANLSNRRIRTSTMLEALDLSSMVDAPHFDHGEKAILPMWAVRLERRLRPFCSIDSGKWSDYSNYLCEYYERLSPEFLRKFARIDPEVYPADGAGNIHVAARFCDEMEERLLSEWRCWLSSSPDYFLPGNIIIESSLIQGHAHSSRATPEEFSVTSAIAFVCIAMEADLICELLRHGAEPTHDIIEQSSMFRLCALSLLDLNGDQSVLAAAVMMGIAMEAKMICDWVKKNKKLVNFSSSTPYELEWCRLTRSTSLGVMTTIVQNSFEMKHVAMAEG